MDSRNVAGSSLFDADELGLDPEEEDDCEDEEFEEDEEDD